jgi:DNA ligase-1
MLAQKYFDDPDKLVPDGEEFILTTKLDGIRCVCINRGPDDIKFFSRQGQPIEYLNDIIKEVKCLPSGCVYDGELVLKNDNNLESKDLYRATVKVVNSDSQDKKNVIFNVFDMVPVSDFENGLCIISAYDRKQYLHKVLCESCGTWVKEVEMLYVGKDKSFITYWLDNITDNGGEGVMINLSKGQYTCKRSKDLLKVKKMKTCDIKVIGYEEGTGQNVGRLGALKCIFIGPDGKEYGVKVGSGYSEEERIDLWAIRDDLIGTIIETQYFEISSNEQGNYSLRFPVFKGRRFDKTEISMY